MNEEGTLSQLGGSLCEIDDKSGLPIVMDDDGNSLYCQTNATMWPKGNSTIIAGDTTEAVQACSALLNFPFVQYQTCKIQYTVKAIQRKIDAEYYKAACDAIDGIADLIKGETGNESCSEMCLWMNGTFL